MTRLRLKPRTYAEVAESIELAIAAGYRRAHKHTDKPTAEYVQECIEREVMNTLSEVVDFEV